MQGYSHALTGAAAWLALTSTSGAALGWYEQPVQAVLTGTVVCAGAALLPDLDHPQGTIAWSLPPVKAGDLTLIPSPTKAMCEGVAAISGGHRHGTHSIVGIAVFTALAWAASLYTVVIHGRSITLGAGLFVVLLVAFASKALRISRNLGGAAGGRKSLVGGILKSWLGPWVLALGSAAFATWVLGEQWNWLLVAVGVGALLHNIGDSLTVEGVPWLWPWNPKPPKILLRVPILGSVVGWVWQRNGYFRIPILGHTTSTRERIFAFLVATYVVYLLVFEVARLAGDHLLY